MKWLFLCVNFLRLLAQQDFKTLNFEAVGRQLSFGIFVSAMMNTF